MNNFTKTGIAILGVVATLGIAGVANANYLQINVGANGAAEAIGDPGGTNYVNGPTAGATAGPGLPTALGGWPNGPGFAVDTGLPPGGGNMGISGWDGSYLNLAQAGNVAFQFMGKGDAANHDIFQVWNGAWTTIWDNQSTSNGTCGTNSPTAMDCSFAGSSYSQFFNAGLLAFQFVDLTTGLSAINDGTGNARPEDGVSPGYFLGMDPYLASGAYTGSGSAAYIGFTDKGCTPGAACDHDYEDLVVRASVPEPGTILLLAAGLMGLAFGRRRQA